MTTDLTALLIQEFRWNDPGPHVDHLVSDLSGWWRHPRIIRDIGPALADLFRAERPTVVVSPEVTGFLLGPLVASALEVGFVEAYKSTRRRIIAEPMTWARAEPDYRGRELGIGVRDRQLRPTDRVLVVDDWVVTGAQVRALHQVVAGLGATAVGTAAVIGESTSAVREQLGLRVLLRGTDLPDR